MNEPQSARFYLVMVALFMATLLGATLYFLFGLGQSTYLVTDGASVFVRYLDKPRYDTHLQGLIFTLCFLIAAFLLLLVVLLPNGAVRPAGYGYLDEEEPPQPRRRTDRGEGAPPREPEPEPEAAPAPEEPPPASLSPLSIEAMESEEPPPARPRVSLDEEVAQAEAPPQDDLPEVGYGGSRFDDSGEEDVVYGDGRISEDAAWEFIQQFPDSAVKFLYRKNLDNKPLSPTEEDIYRNWEMRGLTRARVREIVLELMGWPSLPDSFPHEIWRAVRDQVFELRTH